MRKIFLLTLLMAGIAIGGVYSKSVLTKKQNLTVTHYKLQPTDTECLPCAEMGAETDCTTDNTSGQRCQCIIPEGQPNEGNPAQFGTQEESCVDLWKPEN